MLGMRSLEGRMGRIIGPYELIGRVDGEEW